jgi:hypothetical protein
MSFVLQCLVLKTILEIWNLVLNLAYTTGKNATDAAMVIDAMDLLYPNRFGAFCFVSSDSDFTQLASRIRKSGLLVYGCGERKTSKPFVTACDKFIYVENLTPRNDIVKELTTANTFLKSKVGLLTLITLLSLCGRLWKRIQTLKDGPAIAPICRVRVTKPATPRDYTSRAPYPGKRS